MRSKSRATPKRKPATKSVKKAAAATRRSAFAGNKADPRPDPGFARIAAEYAGDPLVTSGKMMASYGLRVRNKIFAMHFRGSLVVKLPKLHVDELVASGDGQAFEPGPGRVMKEWVVIADERSWSALARAAYAFVK